ncbi:enoyl-CoA hydratase [Coxiella burnetii Dugway 5J108-111]|uniref:Enoyl-CoA hydratase n=2 Tax=Coxiella burnetii TaxID=777 RepID=B5XHJ5_COXBN|nr:enoyl-CoA hydratase [Coxiella burnetii Dugway 5J108-111]
MELATMNYQTIIIEKKPLYYLVTLNRPQIKNSLDITILQELHAALDEIEKDKEVHSIILQGQIGVFCTGMDFTNLQPPKSRQPSDNTLYIKLLHRFVTFPRIIISCVEGAVIAGGMGLVASSDLVVATSQSQFSLSEAIWGLLPVCVTPYLIRRVGFQAAYRLGFTTETIDAKEAYRLQLIDLLSDEPLKKFTPMSCALAVLIYARLKD